MATSNDQNETVRLVNHVRTLLLNRDGNSRPSADFPGEKYVVPNYRAIPLPGYIKSFFTILFGSDPDDLMLNYRLAQIMNILHNSPYADQVVSAPFDSRLTYSPRERDMFEHDFGQRITNTNDSDYAASLIGAFVPDEGMGRLMGSWQVIIVDSRVAQIRSLTDNSVRHERFTVASSTTSLISIQGQDLTLRLAWAPGDPDPPIGTAWTIEASARPTKDLSEIVVQLRGAISQNDWVQLFGAGRVEPYATYRAMWNTGELAAAIFGLIMAIANRLWPFVKVPLAPIEPIISSSLISSSSSPSPSSSSVSSSSVTSSESPSSSSVSSSSVPSSASPSSSSVSSSSVTSSESPSSSSVSSSSISPSSSSMSSSSVTSSISPSSSSVSSSSAPTIVSSSSISPSSSSVSSSSGILPTPPESSSSISPSSSSVSSSSVPTIVSSSSPSPSSSSVSSSSLCSGIQALYFDGDDQVNLPANQSLLQNEKFTIEGWFKSGDTSDKELVMYAEEDEDVIFWSLQLETTNGKVVVKHEIDSDIKTLTSNTAGLNDNEWHCVRLTNDGDTYRLYIDGCFDNSMAVGNELPLNPGDITKRYFGHCPSYDNWIGFLTAWRLSKIARGEAPDTSSSSSSLSSSPCGCPNDMWDCDLATIGLYTYQKESLSSSSSSISSGAPILLVDDSCYLEHGTIIDAQRCYGCGPCIDPTFEACVCPSSPSPSSSSVSSSSVTSSESPSSSSVSSSSVPTIVSSSSISPSSSSVSSSSGILPEPPESSSSISPSSSSVSSSSGILPEPPESSSSVSPSSSSVSSSSGILPEPPVSSSSVSSSSSSVSSSSVPTIVSSSSVSPSSSSVAEEPESSSSSSAGISPVGGTKGALIEGVEDYIYGPMTLYTGSRVGDGTDNKELSGWGMRPYCTFIKDANSDNDHELVWRSYQYGTQRLGAPASLSDSMILQWLKDGAIIGNSDHVNMLDHHYWDIGIGFRIEERLGVKARVGSYVGDGGDNRVINNWGIDPDFVIIVGEATHPVVFKTDRHVEERQQSSSSSSSLSSGTLLPGATSYFKENPDASNLIQRLIPGGVELGSHNDVNQLNETYHYLALEKSADGEARMCLGVYFAQEDAQDEFFIPTPIKPAWVMVCGEASISTMYAAIASKSMTMPAAERVYNRQTMTNAVTAMDEDGFWLGANVAAQYRQYSYIYMVIETDEEEESSSSVGGGSSSSAG